MILCEDCKTQAAVVHFKQVINNQVTELHLCVDCANRRAGSTFWIDPGSVAVNLMAGLLPVAGAQKTLPPAAVSKACPSCGTLFSEFAQTATLGCVQCYATFRKEVEEFLRRMQGSTGHMGKIPKRAGGGLRARREIIQLKSALHQAVAREDYEEAARLRDRIRSAEEKD